MIEKKLLAMLGVALIGVGLMGSPALAKCPKDCKAQFRAELKSCKSTCSKGKTGKPCRLACKQAKRASAMKCKAATSPTPPACSPSGAFLDLSEF